MIDWFVQSFSFILDDTLVVSEPGDIKSDDAIGKKHLAFVELAFSLVK